MFSQLPSLTYDEDDPAYDGDDQRRISPSKVCYPQIIFSRPHTNSPKQQHERHESRRSRKRRVRYSETSQVVTFDPPEDMESRSRMNLGSVSIIPTAGIVPEDAPNQDDNSASERTSDKSIEAVYSDDSKSSACRVSNKNFQSATLFL
jgi:hypothetical protein